MKITILGGAGFIGTNLALRLCERESDHLTVVDREKGRLERLKALCPKRVAVEKRDLDAIRNLEPLLKGQDVVYQLISRTVPAISNRQIPRGIHDSVKWTAEFLEACVRCQVGKVIFISSGGTVYGREHPCPLRENMETWPVNSYGVEKLMDEKLLYLYHHIHGLDYRILRLANPFGPYQRPDGVQGVVAAFAYRAIKKEPIQIYGDGSVVRDYLYIDDAARGIIKAAEGDGKEKLFNIGSGKGTSIHQLIRILEACLGTGLSVKYLPGRSVDVPENVLDITRYETAFGPLASVSLEEGIKRTVDFIRKEYVL